MAAFLFLLASLSSAVAQKEGEEKGSLRGGVKEIVRGLEKAREKLPFELHGFSEGAVGFLPAKNRLIRNHSFNLMEGRFQLKTRYYPEKPSLLPDWGTELAFKADFVGDGIEEAFEVDFRELNGRLSPLSFLDFKIGRQILTWGTGDLIFINDLFPKDFVSFFIGREDEYLKSPSDALKASVFSKWANLDFVLAPFFDPDNPIRGYRLSFYSPLAGRIVGFRDAPHNNRPSRRIENMEYAMRLYRAVGSYEVALYGYRGFYKQAVGVSDPATNDLFYPELGAAGGSVRGPLLGGIGNLEVGFYDSRQDDGGGDPFVENSSLRYLAGYERTLGTDFTAGVQYYVEEMLDFGDYRRNRIPGSHELDEFRHVLTLRLTKLLLSQNLEVSLFTFYSPSDEDAHFRPRISYDISDHWNVAAGANVFFGAEDFTFFGQLKDDNNLYARVRYSF